MAKLAPGTGKRADKRRARKAEFMREAAKVFLRAGLRDATMDDVAAQIGVSKVVLYRYFASKEELVDAILEQMTESLLEADRKPWQGYEDSIMNSVSVAWEDPAAFLLLARDAKSDPVFGRHHRAVWEGVADRLTKAFEGFGLKADHARMSGEAMTSYVINAEVHWIEHGAPERDREFAEWASAGTHALDRQWRKQYGNYRLENARKISGLS